MLNRAKIVIFCSVFAIISIVSPAQPDSVIKYIENFDFRNLNNGLRLVVIENPGMKDVFCRIEFKLPKEVEEKYVGYQEIVGLLIGSATSSINKGQLSADFQHFNIVLKPDANRLLFSFPQKNLDTAIYYLSEILLKPEFDPGDLNILKRRKVREIQSYRRNADSLILLSSRFLYFPANHFYRKIRTEENVKDLSINKVEEFYKKYFKPNLTTILFYGNLKSKLADSLLNCRLGSWIGNNLQADDKVFINDLLHPKIYFIEDSTLTDATICFTNPFSDRLIHYDASKINIINKILDDSIKSHPEFRNHTSTFTEDFYSGWHSTIYKTDRNINETVDIMLTLLRNIKMSIVLNDNLKEFAKYMTGDFGRILAEPEFVTELTWNLLNNSLPRNYYSGYKKEISLDELMPLATKIIRPETPLILISGNRKKLSKGLIMLASKADIEFIHKSNLSTYKIIPRGFNAQNVINNYISAIGGQKQIAKLADLYMKIKGSYSVDSTQYPVEWMIYHKPRNNYRFSQTMMVKDTVKYFVRQQVYDGDKGSDSTKLGYKVLLGKELEELKIRSMLIPELAYSEMGVKIEILSIDTLNQADVFKIKVNFPLGIEQYDYYNLEDSLKVRSERIEPNDKGLVVKEFIEYGSYQDISNKIGVRIPFQKIVNQSGSIIAMMINTIDAEIKLNKEIFIVRKEIKK